MPDTDQLVKDEERIVEMVKEWLWDNTTITDHIKDKVQHYWGEQMGFDLLVNNAMTEQQEEFVCQCQVQLMMSLLAKVMVS